jgi:hypothetical protein
MPNHPPVSRRIPFPATAWTAFNNLPDGTLDPRLPFLARRLHERGVGALQDFLAALLAHQMPTQFAIAMALERAARFDVTSEDDCFSVNTETNTFFCRGCRAQGDVIILLNGSPAAGALKPAS